jgi:hypothetical protein
LSAGVSPPFAELTGPRVVRARRERVLGREAVVDSHDRTPRRVHDAGAQRVLGVEGAEHHPAAVVPYEDGRARGVGVEDADAEGAEVDAV